jgi:hypothetical protein
MKELSDLPLFSDDDERKLQASRLPFGGLFGNTVLLRVIWEITADPSRQFRPKDLEILTASSAPRIKNALDMLVSQGMLENVSKDAQRPVFHVNRSSKRLMALTLLAYAVTDDRDGTDCMKDAVCSYYDQLNRSETGGDEPKVSIFTGSGKELRICMSDQAAEKLSMRLEQILEEAGRRGEIDVKAH